MPLPVQLRARFGSTYGIAIVFLFVAGLGLRLYKINTPLLEAHDFRQTQTALSAYWMAKEGVSLPAYPLPICGEPWSAPFEFPLFQMAAAMLIKLGLPIDGVVRGLSVAIYLSLALLVLAFLRRAKTAPSTQLLFVGFALLTPFSIQWSRACLIDFLSVLLSFGALWFVAEAAQSGWSWSRFFWGSLLSSLTALVKITTLPLLLLPVLCLSIEAFLAAKRGTARSSAMVRWRSLLPWLLLLGIPITAGLLWTSLADGVKSASPTTAWLSSANLHSWNFGSLQQRIDPMCWWTLVLRIQIFVLPWLSPFVLLGLIAGFRSGNVTLRVLAAAALGSFSCVFVFFNLYYVHDYYLCALVFPLWLFAAYGLSQLLERLRSYCLLFSLLLLLALGFNAYSKQYSSMSYADFRDHPILQLSQRVRETVPEDQVLVIFGDDWNSRIPYYSGRKALMVWQPSDTSVHCYLHGHEVHFVLADKGERARVLHLWPKAWSKFSCSGFELFEIP